jgi:hypothetical protein
MIPKKRLVRSLAPPAAAGRSDTTALRQEFRAWRASWPTALERNTLLVPEWIAETVVQEAEGFLQAHLPEDYAARLASKAYHLYPRHKHFHKMLNCPGNSGRNNLYMYMRHWTAGWLKRERSVLYKKLPWSYAQGRALPVTGSAVPKNYPAAKKLVMEDCIKPVTG